MGTLPCANGMDGSPYDIFLRYDDVNGDWSYESPAVTMICANIPASPLAPTLLLSALDLILLDW